MAVALLGALGGDAELLADALPRESGASCFADGFGSLAFGLRAGEAGAAQQELGDRGLVGRIGFVVLEALREVVGVIEDVLDGSGHGGHSRTAVPRGAGIVLRYWRVEIHPSALRHGIDRADIAHAVAHSQAVEDLGDDPDRWLVLGPDRAGNLLEIVVLVTVEGDEIAIHAMAMRAKYRRLLER